MRKIFLVFFISFLSAISSCTSQTNNDIYNKTYDVDINIDNIGDAFVPAVEKASESTLGVGVYIRSSLSGNWVCESVGSCVVYETVAVLKDGTKIGYEESKTANNIDYYEYKAVTNAHVLDVKGTYIKNTVYIGELDKVVESKVLGADSELDLAVVTFTETVLIAPITFADSDTVKKGQIVLAVGNPSGYEYYSSATMGIVSYPKRYLNENGIDVEYIQHDAAINPGNSGGALVNVKGELIGINTSKIVDAEIDAIGFAIPSNSVLKVIDRLENNTAIRKQVDGMVSVSVTQLKNDLILTTNRLSNEEIYELEYGVYVHNISNLSLLYGEIKNGDVILEINNKELRYSEELNYLLLLSEQGDKITLLVYRNGTEITVEANL